MIWWLKARRAASVLLPALVVFLGCLLLFQDRVTLLPSVLAGGAVPAPLAMFVPVLPVGALAYSLSSRLPGPEATGTRHTALLDAALILVLVSVAAVGAYEIGVVTHAQGLKNGGRDIAFLAGLMLLGRAVTPNLGALLPVGWLLAVAAVGHRPSGDPYPWTIVPEQAGAAHAAVGAAAALALGLAAHIRTARTARTAEEHA